MIVPEIKVLKMQHKASVPTFKAIIAGIILIFVNVYWAVIGLRWDMAHPTMVSMALLSFLVKSFMVITII